MVVRAAILIALLQMAGQTPAAGPLRIDAGCVAGQSQTPLAGGTYAPSAEEQQSAIALAGPAFTPGPLGDILGALGPNPHARELAQIALAAGADNRDAVQMISSRIRKFGVTSAEIQDAIDQTQLHAGGLAHSTIVPLCPAAVPTW